MFRHKFQDQVPTKVYFHWFLLSSLAGIINAGGYLSCHRFVSHVTGFATLSGISFVENDWLEALGMLVVPAFFLLGVVISGYVTESLSLTKHKYKYAPVFGIVASLLALVAVLGEFGFFGRFGLVAKIEHDFILLACLCTACGLQNAAITTASGSTIRTTHLTGLTTDLGLGIVRIFFTPIRKEQKKIEIKTNWLRIGTILSFTFGSFIGALTFIRSEYIAFLFPATIALYFTFVAKEEAESLVS